MLKKSIRAALVSIFAFSILAGLSIFSGASQAGQRFHYTGLLGGVPVFDLYLTLDLPKDGSGKYQARMEAVTIGTLASIYPYQAEAESEGIIKNGRVFPSQFISQAKAYDKQTNLTLRFHPDGSLMGVPRWKGRIVDPLSALVATMLGENRFCEGMLPIYDGIARYDLTLAAAGENRFVQEEKIGPFILGSVEQCLANIQILEGADPNLAKLGLLPTHFRIGRHADTKPAYLPLHNAFILGFGEIELKLLP